MPRIVEQEDFSAVAEFSVIPSSKKQKRPRLSIKLIPLDGQFQNQPRVLVPIELRRKDEGRYGMSPRARAILEEPSEPQVAVCQFRSYTRGSQDFGVQRKNWAEFDIFFREPVRLLEKLDLFTSVESQQYYSLSSICAISIRNEHRVTGGKRTPANPNGYLLNYECRIWGNYGELPKEVVEKLPHLVRDSTSIEAAEVDFYTPENKKVLRLGFDHRFSKLRAASVSSLGERQRRNVWCEHLGEVNCVFNFDGLIVPIYPSKGSTLAHREEFARAFQLISKIYFDDWPEFILNLVGVRVGNLINTIPSRNQASSSNSRNASEGTGQSGRTLAPRDIVECLFYELGLEVDVSKDYYIYQIEGIWILERTYLNAGINFYGTYEEALAVAEGLVSISESNKIGVRVHHVGDVKRVRERVLLRVKNIRRSAPFLEEVIDEQLAEFLRHKFC